MKRVGPTKVKLQPLRLSKVQGSQEKRARRISNTLSELRTQLTPQFAKSLGGASGLAGRQAKAAQGLQGFTIVELTIATLVFSTVLLVALASYIGIGRVYYKSRSLTETQAVAQQVVNQVTGDIQFAADIVTDPNTTGISTTNGNSLYVCFGNIRYTYNLYQAVDSDNLNNNHFGLVRDTMPGSQACASPYGANAIPFNTNDATELLSPSMRLSEFDVIQAKDAAGANVNNLWDLNVTVAFGDDDVLQNPDNANVSCDANLQSTQFCSISKQTTTVSKGF